MKRTLKINGVYWLKDEQVVFLGPQANTHFGFFRMAHVTDTFFGARLSALRIRKTNKKQKQ